MCGLVACGGGSSDAPVENNDAPVESLADIDLTGSWVAQTETRYYHTETGDYLFSDFGISRFELDDSEEGLKFRGCGGEFGYGVPYSIKSGNRLYLALYETPFNYLGGMRFFRELPKQVENYFPERSYQDLTTLEKISDNVLETAGSFTVTTPQAFTATENICVESNYSESNGSRSVGVTARYLSGYVSFYLTFYGDLEETQYTWLDEGYYPSQQVQHVEFRVSYEEEENFWGTTSYFWASSAAITVLENSAQTLALEYSIVSEDSRVVEGSVSIDKSWLNHSFVQ